MMAPVLRGAEEEIVLGATIFAWWAVFSPQDCIYVEYGGGYRGLFESHRDSRRQYGRICGGMSPV